MTDSRLFAARYHGRCVGCGEPIEPGDHVAFAEDEVVCAGCVYGEPSPPAPGRREPPVCGACHIAHAGECW